MTTESGPTSQRMRDKVVLVTGAAGGLGAATAQLIAAEGAAMVVVADLMTDAGRRIAEEIAEQGGRAEFVHLDVTDEESWEHAMAGVAVRHGRLDALVNNAGISGSSTGDVYDRERWDQLIDVNCTGVYLGIKYGVRAMSSHGGAIVNISSIAGLVGHAGLHLGYNASKGAVRLMTKGAAARHGVDGIRVNSIHPGLLPPMGTSETTRAASNRTAILEKVPMRREGRFTEVAQAVLFLVSDESSYVTGSELVVDGGYTCV